MPELPEVESTAAFLRERVVGKTITGVKVLWPRSIASHGQRAFCNLVAGSVIKAVGRRGKFVTFELDIPSGQPHFLFGHMRMSGSFDVIKSANDLEKHDRVIFNLDNHRDIRFHDPRKFGRFILTDNPSEVDGNLGVEPLGQEFSPQILKEILAARAGAIKPMLLNQALIAGLGNIYVDEALWYARIHPRTVSSKVREPAVTELYRGIVNILTEAIASAGTDFGDGVVYGGGYSPKVYGRTGEKCERCGAKIKRLVVGQRGTHICPSCQRKRR